MRSSQQDTQDGYKLTFDGMHWCLSDACKIKSSQYNALSINVFLILLLKRPFLECWVTSPTNSLRRGAKNERVIHHVG